MNGVDAGVPLPSIETAAAAWQDLDADVAAVLAEASAFRRSRRAMERTEVERLSAELPLEQITLPAQLVAGLTATDVDRLADHLLGLNGVPDVEGN